MTQEKLRQFDLESTKKMCHTLYCWLFLWNHTKPRQKRCIFSDWERFLVVSYVLKLVCKLLYSDNWRRLTFLWQNDCFLEQPVIRYAGPVKVTYFAVGRVSNNGRLEYNRELAKFSNSSDLEAKAGPPADVIRAFTGPKTAWA